MQLVRWAWIFLMDRNQPGRIAARTRERSITHIKLERLISRAAALFTCSGFRSDSEESNTSVAAVAAGAAAAVASDYSGDSS